MPNPDMINNNLPDESIFAERLKQMRLKVVDTPVDEITLLRNEIAGLRREMTPSIILTGQRVIDSYWELTKTY